MRRAGYVLAHNAAPAEIILDWLFATRHLKNPADGEAAKADWARVFAPTAEGRSELVHHSTYVAKETLRLARVRLDCVNNLLMRAMFAATCVDQLALFLFCDGSPQWRGNELWASTLDILFANGDLKRLLLPMVSLARFCLGLAGADWEETANA